MNVQIPSHLAVIKQIPALPLALHSQICLDFETLFVLNTFPNIPKKKKKNHLVYEMLGILLQFRSIYWVVRKEKVRMQKNLSSSKI